MTPRRPLYPLPEERQQVTNDKIGPGTAGGRTRQTHPVRPQRTGRRVDSAKPILAGYAFHSTGGALTFGSLNCAFTVNTGYGDAPDDYWTLLSDTVVNFEQSGWYDVHANCAISGLTDGDEVWMEVVGLPSTPGVLIFDSATAITGRTTVGMSGSTGPFYLDNVNIGAAVELEAHGPTSATVAFGNIVVTRYNRDDA